MASTIKIKNSSTAGAVPTSSDLVQGELAINVTDRRIFTENASGTVVELGTPSIDDNGNATAITIDSSENVGIGTSSPLRKLDVYGDAQFKDASGVACTVWSEISTGVGGVGTDNNYPFAFATNGVERARIDSDGNLLVGKDTTSSSVAGVSLEAGLGRYVRADQLLILNRLSTDGTLVSFLQAGTTEGTISVSGTTVSYNGGHLSRWAQTLTPKDTSLVKGTVLSNLDEMNVYTDADGNPVENEQLNKVKVSDVEGDANVAGVFVNWSYDDAHNVDEINMAMTGDMIIRIAAGTTVARGDLLMSAGDGTAKPQGDDIVRAKTVAKVTSTHVTCTYEDGSYCVPCVLMAC